MADMPDIIDRAADFDPDMDFWLKSAQRAIRKYCGWHVTPSVRLTGTLNSRGGSVLRLPARNITAIHAITDSDGREVPCDLDKDGGLLEARGRTFPVGIAAVKYDIEAGWDDCEDVQGVLLSMARRLATAPAGIVTGQSVNGSSVSYDSATLMRDEKERLAPYRLGGLP